MNLRDSVLIQRNAIGVRDLQFLSDYVRSAQQSDSLVSNEDNADVVTETEWVVNKKIRDTQEVHLNAGVKANLNALDDISIATYINPFFAIEVRDREPIQILHYGIGGHYIPHVDAETLLKDDLGHVVWEKSLDRDLSVVYFLNDDFKGGELVFPSLDLTIKPEAGTLICFPSDHNFIHGVNPVTAGHRFTAVTWLRVKGTPSLEEINRMTVDKYNRMRPAQMIQPPRLAKGGKVAS